MDSDNSKPTKGAVKRTPGGSDTPTTPGERMRKLLEASEEEANSTPEKKEKQVEEQPAAGKDFNGLAGSSGTNEGEPSVPEASVVTILDGGSEEQPPAPDAPSLSDESPAPPEPEEGETSAEGIIPEAQAFSETATAGEMPVSNTPEQTAAAAPETNEPAAPGENIPKIAAPEAGQSAPIESEQELTVLTDEPEPILLQAGSELSKEPDEMEFEEYQGDTGTKDQPAEEASGAGYGEIQPTESVIKNPNAEQISADDLERTIRRQAEPGPKAEGEKAASETIPSGPTIELPPFLSKRKEDPGDAPTVRQEPFLTQPSKNSEDTAPVQVHPAHPTHLPKRVDEVDVNATRVTRAAYGQTPPARPAGNVQQPQALRGQPAQTPPVIPTYATVQKGNPPVSRPKSKPVKKKGLGCFWKGLIGILFVGILAVVAVLSFLIYQYYSIASTLPSVDDLKTKASQFETTRLLDRNGNTLYEIMDPNAGLRTAVTLDKISPYLIAATLATEDKEFYNHPGFDVLALLRALWQNYSAGETVSGASTITQQLAKMLLLSPTEARQQTVTRKAREIILAAELTRKYTKEEILELYLNEINYGNFSYGIEAAAETYFNSTASKLTLGQAAFLAGIPQAPSVYDIFTNRTQTLERFRTVIMLMYNLSQETNCIYVSTNIQRVCVDAVSVSQALDEIEKQTNFTLSSSQIKYPHWVTYIRSLLEAQYDPQTLYRSGFSVYTTLDPALEDMAQTMVRDQVKSLSDKKVTDGALVAIRPETGEILAMVGSADFYNDQIAGQVNMALSPRQPGSSIKPLTYVAAFEKGWTPSTLIWDVPSEFPPSGDPNDTRPPYKPVNYDGRFHGPVTVRTALANSYNIPAVKTLQFIGIYDNPATPGQDGLISMAKKMGITTLTRPDYGMSLTLGGGEVSLLEMTSAYSTFANLGRRMPPYAISKIVDHAGDTVYEYKPPTGDQVIRAEHAFLITSILSDNAARTPAFGPNSILDLPFPAAVKTGTTNDYRDNWTLGYSPDLTVGVWVGNADYTAMVNTTGVTGAAPIWSAFMKAAVPLLTDNKPSSFTRPSGIVERAVCAISGTEPSQWCPSQRGEFFAADQLPLPKEQDLWQKVKVDTWTGYKASTACADFTEEKFALNVTDPFAIKWIKESSDGKKWAKAQGFSDPIYFAPNQDCKQTDSRPQIIFSSFRDGDTISTAPLDIYAVVDATSGFKEFKLEYGIGDKPVEWKQLGDVINQPAKQPTLIYSWDMKDVPPGKISLRIHLTSDHDTYAEKQIILVDQVPTATPTSTTTSTPTLTPTVTPTITPTVTVTPVPTNTPTQTLTLPPPPPPS
ncbi:MAG TPA: transglycosylase domain-containing protein [Anaerolineaceae bacterium]|nr:transglycosylase domain-containing protein [Anaerolineaceae bacterium]